MTSHNFSPQPRPGHLPHRVEELRQELQNFTPASFATRTGAAFNPAGEGRG
jgi:hypothetical protein